jgi:cytochrome P450
VEYNPYNRAIVENPYPTYRWLRDEAPVYHNEKIGFYALSRFEDVLNAHLDTKRFISSNGVTIEGLDQGQDLLINKDDPDHVVHRKIVNRIFTPRTIGELEPRVRRIAADMLEQARDSNRLDVVSDYSAALPMLVIAELLGLPEEIRPALREQSDRVLSAGEADANPEAPQDALQALADMRATFAATIDEHFANPRDDILSLLVTARVDDEDGNEVSLTPAQVADRLVELTIAGHETTAKLVANAAVALTWYPDQRRELAKDPTLMPAAVEEMLRWDPPSHYQGRWVEEDVTLHGETIPADSRVILVTGAANHDERQFEEPELFDIHRKIERHVGFGFGTHLCIGAALARLETRIAFEELLARFPDYELDGPATRAWSTNVRGLAHLPLVLDPSR